MEMFVKIIHVSVSVFLAIVVLLQHGKGADIGATFGGSSQTVFGARGAATLLSKVTVASAVIFMVTSVTLARMSSSSSGKSLMSGSQGQGKVLVKDTPSPQPSVKSTSGTPSK